MLGDARWHDRLTSQLWRRVLFVLICAAPFLTGLFGRISRHDHIFSDYESIACAGQKAAEGASVYSGDLACAGMEPYPFVYLPYVANAHADAASFIGPTAVEILYGAVFLAAIAFTAWLIFYHRDMPGRIWDRMPALGLVTGGTIYSGNIAVILHAMICAAALVAQRRPWLFALAVALATSIKPTFLTYGLVLLVLPIPIWKRLLWGAVAGLGGLAPPVLFLASGTETSGNWAQTLQTMMFEAAPGITFVDWLHLFGIEGLSGPAIAAWLVLVALLIAATIAVSIAGKLETSHRTWLAVGVAALANPRLMEYDTPWLLAFLGALFAAARLPQLSDVARRRFIGVLAVVAVLAAVGNSLDAGDYTSPLFTFVGCAGLMALALMLWRTRRASAA